MAPMNRARRSLCCAPSAVPSQSQRLVGGSCCSPLEQRVASSAAKPCFLQCRNTLTLTAGPQVVRLDAAGMSQTAPCASQHGRMASVTLSWSTTSTSSARRACGSTRLVSDIALIDTSPAHTCARLSVIGPWRRAYVVCAQICAAHVGPWSCAPVQHATPPCTPTHLCMASTGGRMARELSKNPTVLIVNDTIFAHGGVMPVRRHKPASIFLALVAVIRFRSYW